jgi:hypothetical protein
MTPAEIGWAITTGYLGLALLCARHQYQRLRPLTVPASCDYLHDGNLTSRHHVHQAWCYRQPEREGWMIDSNREAAGYALVLSLAWPVVVLILGATRVVMGGKARPHPLEVRGRIAELERELGLPKGRAR